ncbi:hypothetical protein WMF28_29955 [Sorangium sp. So ce590]|uniref:hypothetical protein n=1 Tax=Sorangium sp. So ce590 TaxID=3133317 RepID=UPI003F63837A
MNTSISLFFGLMMFQTFGAGCTARVQVGDSSGDQEVGPDGAAGGVESSVGSGGAGGGGGFSSTSVSSVAVGSGGFSSTSVSSVAVGAGGGDSAPTAGAIALFRCESPGEPSNCGSSSSAGPGTDPYDLFIVFGAPVSSCADPSNAIGCDNWQLIITIPPALQVPGIIDLSELELWSGYVMSSRDRGGNCLWSEGSFASGTMEIVSIDAAEVVVRLSGTDTHDFDANGEYTAARCP